MMPSRIQWPISNISRTKTSDKSRKKRRHYNVNEKKKNMKVYNDDLSQIKEEGGSRRRSTRRR